MKTKLYIYVSRPEAYIKGDMGWSLMASHISDLKTEWGCFLAGEVEVDLKPDLDAMRQYVLKTIKGEKAELLGKLNLLDIKENELLALEAQ